MSPPASFLPVPGFGRAATRAAPTQKRGGGRSSRTAHPADEKAVAPQAQGVFRGGVSSVALRSRRSVTAAAQALDHSLPGKPERSLPPLGLLFPTRTASLGSRGGPESGVHPSPICRGGCPHPPAICPAAPAKKGALRRGGACPRPRAAPRAAPTDGMSRLFCILFNIKLQNSAQLPLFPGQSGFSGRAFFSH